MLFLSLLLWIFFSDRSGMGMLLGLVYCRMLLKRMNRVVILLMLHRHIVRWVRVILWIHHWILFYRMRLSISRIFDHKWCTVRIPVWCWCIPMRSVLIIHWLLWNTHHRSMHPVSRVISHWCKVTLVPIMFIRYFLKLFGAMLILFILLMRFIFAGSMSFLGITLWRPLRFRFFLLMGSTIPRFFLFRRLLLTFFLWIPLSYFLFRYLFAFIFFLFLRFLFRLLCSWLWFGSIMTNWYDWYVFLEWLMMSNWNNW